MGITAPAQKREASKEIGTAEFNDLTDGNKPSNRSTDLLIDAGNKEEQGSKIGEGPTRQQRS